MEHVTIRDIARICKVGVSTVSSAINNHPDINPETKKLILDTIREYNYVPNNSAQNLKRTETNTIALVTKGVGNPLFAEMIEITQRHVKGKDYAFVLQQVEEEENEIMAAIRIARERRLKGIIFMGGASQPDVSLLKALTIPYVFCTVDSRIPESLSGWGIVAIDNEAESYKIVDYLCSKGHRRIAILTAYAHDTSIGKLRLDGYRRALKDHGIEEDPALVAHMRGTGPIYTMQNGYDRTKELLASGTEILRHCMRSPIRSRSVRARQSLTVASACRKISLSPGLTGWTLQDIITRRSQPLSSRSTRWRSRQAGCCSA